MGTWLGSKPPRLLHGLSRNEDRPLPVYPPVFRPSLVTNVDRAAHKRIKIEAGRRIVVWLAAGHRICRFVADDSALFIVVGIRT